LHIHIDCVRPDVSDALAAYRDAIAAHWVDFPAPLVGQHWRALRVNGENLGTVNPFRLLASGKPDVDMARHTLAVVGMTWGNQEPGFVLLDGTVDLAAGNRGSAEILQDHDCALAH
jgi:CDP-diacylglycerol pyrophosphatase